MASVIALGAAGSYPLWQSQSSLAEWIAGVIRRNLPGVQLDEPSLAAFCQAGSSRDGRFLGSARRRSAVLLAQAVPALANGVPRLNTALEELERMIVSEYLLGSNFFHVADVMSETIIYAGRSPACGNPFATFQP